MVLFRYPRPLPSEITPREMYLSRRSLIGGAAALGAVSATADAATLQTHPGPYSGNLTPTPHEDVTHYNNFYEFGMGKADPATQSQAFHPLPWTLEITGLVRRPVRLDVEQLLRSPAIEERIYRMRCVEAWSMVIPWDGIPLATLLKDADPDPRATHVAFESIVRPSEMPGQNEALSGIQWPYVEGLRLDEAMNPLTLLALALLWQN